MLRAVPVLITTDFYKEEKYILSKEESSIKLPYWEVEDYRNLQHNISNSIVSDVFVDKQMASGYIKPKFISINDEVTSELFPDSKDYLYFLYGCVCPKLEINNNFFWKTFDIYDTNIPLELKLINNVISTTI